VGGASERWEGERSAGRRKERKGREGGSEEGGKRGRGREGRTNLGDAFRVLAGEAVDNAAGAWALPFNVLGNLVQGALRGREGGRERGALE